MAEIAVDPDEVRSRGAALKGLSEAVHGVRMRAEAPDCGDPLADAAVAAVLGAVRDSLPLVAIELFTVSTIVVRAATLYERVDDGIASD